MTHLTALRNLLQHTPSHHLHAMLACGPASAIAIMAADGQTVIEIPIARAQGAIRAELDDRHSWSVSDELHLCAQFDPMPYPDGLLNIASWVGAGTREWHTVFAYSSPESAKPDAARGAAHWSWFCQLDPETQRWVLLLVATVEGDRT